MAAYTIRGAEPGDCGAIAAVYNSDPDFLRAHLGTELVTEPFILAELAQMRALGFRSCVIEDGESGEIQGVLDYRPGGEVYLSLLMLRAELHRSGAGRAPLPSASTWSAATRGPPPPSGAGWASSRRARRSCAGGSSAPAL